jgi:hypothetical protein
MYLLNSAPLLDSRQGACRPLLHAHTNLQGQREQKRRKKAGADKSYVFLVRAGVEQRQCTRRTGGGGGGGGGGDW